jgi:hypothetical protein
MIQRFFPPRSLPVQIQSFSSCDIIYCIPTLRRQPQILYIHSGLDRRHLIFFFDKIN